MPNIFAQFGKATQSENIFSQFDEPTTPKTDPIPDPISDTSQQLSDSPQSDPWASVLLEGIKNIPASGGKFIGDIASTLRHPIDTAKSLGNIIEGAIVKAGTLAQGDAQVPGVTVDPVLAKEQTKEFDLLVDYAKDRYGSIDGLKKSIAKDPVGVIADISTILIPGGSALKGAGAATKLKTLSKAGSALQKGGTFLDPVSLVAKGVSKGLQSLPKDLPSNLYQSAAKFSTVLTENQRAKLANTALENRIMPTAQGLDNLRSKINVLNSEISDMISTATQSGERIPIDRLFNDFNKLKKEAMLTAEPQKALRMITGIKENFIKANKEIGRNKFTPEQAQKLKQNIYKELQSFYGKSKNAPMTGKAKMAMAKAAKEGLEEIFPEIKGLNKSEGALIELSKEIERSASRISNRDIIGIGVPIKGGLGGAVGDVPGMVGGIALGLLDTPKVKAKLAILLNDMRAKGININPNSAAFRLGIITPERIKQEE